MKYSKYSLVLLIGLFSIIYASDVSHNSTILQSEHAQESHDKSTHKFEGVTGAVIMHHMLDDRVFEIFNPFNIHHPIELELYPEGGEPYYSINKPVVMMWLNSILIILLFTIGYKKDKKVQSGVGNLLEILIVFIRDEVVYVNMGKKQGRRFLPLILTFFFFILTMNLMGLIPGTATPTANINVTAALAIITFLTYVIFGNKDFWKHIFATPGVPLWLLPIMIPVELLGLLTKPFALAVRLFANMNAGHIIILAFLGIIINLQNYWVALGSVPMAVAINLLEIFVAFLQAYVFSLLSTIFISMAVTEHKEHEAH
jgi:F-type H+-transporting ATPase subunit a